MHILTMKTKQIYAPGKYAMGNEWTHNTDMD